MSLLFYVNFFIVLRTSGPLHDLPTVPNPDKQLHLLSPAFPEKTDALSQRSTAFHTRGQNSAPT